MKAYTLLTEVERIADCLEKKLNRMAIPIVEMTIERRNQKFAIVLTLTDSSAQNAIPENFKNVPILTKVANFDAVKFAFAC